MDLMARRQSLILSHGFTVGGLPVLYDNALYPSKVDGTTKGRRKINDIFKLEGWAIIGPFETGAGTASHSYRVSYPDRPFSDTSSVMLFFNDLSANAYDYWAIYDARTFSSKGLYVAFGVKKETAANMYMYDNTSQQYIYKGKNVT